MSRESKEIYRLSNTTDPGLLINDLNRLFGLLGERLDRIEGRRPDLSAGFYNLEDDKDISTSTFALQVSGTTYQITVTDNGDGTITLSLPDSLQLNGATASRLLATDADKKTASVADLTAWIAGTANEITVTDDGDGTITLDLPDTIQAKQLQAKDANGLKLYEDGGKGIFIKDSSGYVGILDTNPASPLEISDQEGTYADSIRITGNLAIGGYDLAGYAAQRGALKAKLLDGSGVHKGYISFVTPGGDGPGLALTDTTGTQTIAHRSFVQHVAAATPHLQLESKRVYITDVLGVGDVPPYASPQLGVIYSKLYNDLGVHQGYFKLVSPGSAGVALRLSNTTDAQASYAQHNNSGNYLELNSGFVQVSNVVKLVGNSASRLLATDANKKTASSDLANWIAGTSYEVDVTDDGDGTVTLGIPARSGFLVNPSAQQNNFAIGGWVTAVFDSEVYDHLNEFAANTFTATAAGKYHFDVLIEFKNIDTASTYYEVRINTSNRNYISIFTTSQFAGDLPYWSVQLSVDADMDASDTAYVEVYQEGSGAQQSDIGTLSWFSGHLVSAN